MPNIPRGQKDYYYILGVDENATVDEIKRAYRKLAMEHHPDRNPGNPDSEQKFKEIAEAYAVLSDPQKRNRYDHGGFSNLEDMFGFGFGGTDPFEIFRSVVEGFSGFPFGGGESYSTGKRVTRGNDLKASVELTLEEISEGVEKTLKVKRQDRCDECKGSGIPPDAEVKVCETCKGRGQVKKVSEFLLGHSIRIITCPDCGGRGKIPSDFCKKCRGSGRQKIEDEIKIKFPAGVKEGNYVVVDGKGDVGPQNGPPGVLIAFVKEKKHPHFVRREDNLLYQKSINFSQAALGTKVKVPTLNSDKELKIPPGTQTGDIFKFKNDGIPHVNSGGRGDLIVRVTVITPTKLTKEEKKLFENLKELQGDKVPEIEDDYLKKIRDFFGI